MWWYWPDVFPCEPLFPEPIRTYPIYYCRGGNYYPWVC